MSNGAPEGGRPARLGPQLMLIGIDGATLDLIEPWIKAGDLPTLGRLMEAGAHGHLFTTPPPSSPSAWTSFMTGKNPGKHGIFGFYEAVPNSYAVRHTNGASRRAKTIWKILSESGKRVGIMGVPMTYPPEEVAGYLIAGMDAPDERSPFIYPPSLQQELSRKFGKVETIVYHFPQKLGNSYRSAHHAYTLWERLEERRTRICQHLIRTYPTDLVMIHFFAVDQIQHYFWHYMDPTHPLYDPDGARLLGGLIKNIYRKIDDLVGELLAGLPTESSVMILSDHGAGPHSSGRHSINTFLASLGLLRFKDAERPAPRLSAVPRFALKETYRLVKRAVPSGLKTWLTWAFPGAREMFESQLATGQIDWSATKAYCMEKFGSSIWVNLKGVRPSGVVEPGAEYEELLALITKKFYEIKDPATGAQMIPRVHRKEEIYTGPYLNMAPDLLIDSWLDRAFLQGQRAATHRDRSLATHEKPKGRSIGVKTASHRYNGMVVLKGGAFKEGHTLAGAQIIDMAPTILYLMGLPVPDDMDGRVLTEALKDTHLGRHPVRFCKADDADQGTRSTSSHDDGRKVEERLRSLGYVD